MNHPFQDPYQPSAQPPIIPSPAQPGGVPWGCLLGGCFGSAVLMFLLVIGLLWGGYRAVQGQINKYTSSEPVNLPQVEASQEQIQAIQQRFELFEDQFKQGLEPQELVITIDEINQLIYSNEDLRGHVFIKVVDGDLQADISFSTDEIPGGSGRYFNGSIKMHVELEDGVLVAKLVDAEANGQAIPESILAGFKQENLAKDIYKDVKNAQALQRCEKLEIQSDRIILKIRQKRSSAPKADEEPVSPPPQAEINLGAFQ